MRISSFLTFIVFCFLLFMEPETAEQAAYNLLRTTFSTLSERLKDLKDNIHAQGPTTKEIEKVNGLIESVDSAHEELGKKTSKEVEKNITISNPVQEVQVSVFDFTSPTHKFSHAELNTLLDKIEQIWKKQIQTEVEKAKSYKGN